MGFGIFLSGIVDVIGCHKRNAEFLSHTDELLVYIFLLRDAMVLQFQIIMVCTEQFCIFGCCTAGGFIISLCKQLWDLPCKTAA